MNLNLRAEKQNYCLISLNYAFPFPALNRKTIFYFKKKKSYFLRLRSAFTKIFVFNNGQITECYSNLLEEMNHKWDCIVSKNTCFQQIFVGT